MRLQSPGVISSLLVVLAISSLAYPGVSKEVETQYSQKYANKAMFLKVPIRGDQQIVHVLEGGSSLDPSNLGQPLRFKVGEQVRIASLSFKDSSIEFRLTAIDSARKGSVVFQFRNSLRHSFPSKSSFDAALKNSFTEGLSYQEIDSAKEGFIQDQFDSLLRQFAVTTGTSVDFVLDAVTERNPKYRQVKQQLDEVAGQVQKLEVDLQEERGLNQRLRKDAEKAVNDLAAANQSHQSLRNERDRVVTERKELENKVRTLEEENGHFRKQIEDVAGKLNVQTDSSAKLGQQVQSLSLVIDSMKQERSKLSGQVEGLNQKVADLTSEKRKLASSLESSERKKQQLQSDLNSLTSNRNSLEATYLKVKRNKENLERAKAVEVALRVERSVEDRKNGQYQISSLYLLDQKIAVLEVQEPVYSNHDYVVTFRVESPDTVEFTAEEREFYETLGEKFRVETNWESASGQLEPVLEAGEKVQKVGPREEAEWTWSFHGVLSEPESVILDLTLVDVDEQGLEAISQEYQLAPSGWLAQLGGAFSLGSLLLGLGLGVVCGLVVGSVRRRTRPLRGTSSRGREFAAQKKL